MAEREKFGGGMFNKPKAIEDMPAELQRVLLPKEMQTASTKEVAKPEAELVPAPKQTTGTYGKPYLREDGTLMTKWGLHVPLEFVNQFKWFMGHLGVTQSASEFVVRAVTEKMTREIALRKRDGRWKNYEKMLETG